MWAPSTRERWTAALSLAFGGALGWMTHPAVWIVFGPARWQALILSTAAQESAFNPGAIGDLDISNSSVGILQFQATTWTSLGGDSTDRTSPFWSGYYAAAYVQSALFYDLRWLVLGVPFYGHKAARVLWRYGVDDAERAIDAEFTADLSGSEGQYEGAWTAWRTISIVVLLPILATWWHLSSNIKPRKGVK